MKRNDWFKSPINILLGCLILLGVVSYSFAEDASLKESKFHRLKFYFSESCNACQKVKAEVLPLIEKEFYDKVIIEFFSTSEEKNYKDLVALKEKYGIYDDKVPTVFIGDKALSGSDQIIQEWRQTLVSVLAQDSPAQPQNLPPVDLPKRFLSFSALTIVIAGLLDGFNPCAFTVIVFFVTFLSLQGYRKRQLLGIGLAFIMAVMLTYILIGVGIFRFLYALDAFHAVTKIVYYSVAGLCFFLAGLALYDIWVFETTGKTEAMALQLPQAVKNRIHSLIGYFYRKPPEGSGAPLVTSRPMGKLLVSAFVTGFLVSLLESVCTGQLYLPTITFMLKDPHLRLRAFAYLLLYNFMFIVPLIAVLALALFGTTSDKFSRFMHRRLILIKGMMVLVFVAMGLLILMKG